MDTWMFSTPVRDTFVQKNFLEPHRNNVTIGAHLIWFSITYDGYGSTWGHDITSIYLKLLFAKYQECLILETALEKWDEKGEIV